MARYQVLLGGGCFWGVQEDLDSLPGVVETEVGYAGGHLAHPDYKTVCSGTTGHAEVVRVVAEDQALALEDLIRIFFKMHDPTQGMRQGVDHGAQYRSVIIVPAEADAQRARAVIQQTQRLWPRPITTEVRVGDPFYPAEDYHQHYCRRRGG